MAGLFFINNTWKDMINIIRYQKNNMKKEYR